MNAFLLQYLPIVIFLGVGAALGIAFTVLPTIIAPKAPDAEKLSTYECGFNAFDDARMKFDVRFYLVSILFIIFDLEVAFLFPWGVALMKLPHQTAVFAFARDDFAAVFLRRWISRSSLATAVFRLACDFNIEAARVRSATNVSNVVLGFFSASLMGGP